MGWMYDCNPATMAWKKTRKGLDIYFDEGWSEGVQPIGNGAKVGNVYYRALECPNGERRIFVALLGYSKSEGFGYKSMSDAMGPVVKTCPRRILDAAGGVEGAPNEWAREWRTACYANLGNGKSPKEGDLIEFGSIIYFSNFTAKRFRVSSYKKPGAKRKSTIFVVADGGPHDGIPVRIANWRKMAWSLV